MTTIPITFSRSTDRPFEHSLDALARWRPRDVRGVDLGCATIDVPHGGGPDRYRLRLRLRGRARALPMELRLTPWSETWGTHLELLPLRSVRPSNRYLRKGRAVLDDVIATIVDGSADAGKERRAGATSDCLLEST
jgi:hypothetical protein